MPDMSGVRARTRQGYELSCLICQASELLALRVESCRACALGGMPHALGITCLLDPSLKPNTFFR
jgi:hypothetical protein